VDKGQANPDDIDRYVTITEPTGGKQLYAFVQYPPFEPAYYAAALVPTNTPIGTLDNDPASNPNERDSYYWNSQQYAALSTTNIANFTTNDYIKARMRHWLGYEVHGAYRSVDTISIQRDASQDGVNGGQLTWFDYTNKGGYGEGDQGDQILPAVIAQVVMSGNTMMRKESRRSRQSQFVFVIRHLQSRSLNHLKYLNRPPQSFSATSSRLARDSGRGRRGLGIYGL
jgi:hypothetical protein